MSPTQVPATGWAVEIVHPTSGRVIRPSVLDDPQILPSLNGFPRIRIPVRRDPNWLTPAFDDDPDMTVWFNGVEQPIDELRSVEHDEGKTVLVGKGGVELEQRVQAAYDTERRETAAKNLITNHTSYTADVDTPQTEVDTDQFLESVSTTADLEERVIHDDTSPLLFSNELGMGFTTAVAAILGATSSQAPPTRYGSKSMR